MKGGILYIEYIYIYSICYIIIYIYITYILHTIYIYIPPFLETLLYLIGFIKVDENPIRHFAASLQGVRSLGFLGITRLYSVGFLVKGGILYIYI